MVTKPPHNYLIWTGQQDGPLYWVNETTGTMRAIVSKCLSDDDDLTADELDVLTWYVRQWIDGVVPLPPPDYEQCLLGIRTKGDLRRYLHELLRDYGIDVF